MACSDCYPGNSTVMLPGANVSITGSGIVGDPFVISANEVENGDLSSVAYVEATPALNLYNILAPTTVHVTLNANASLNLPQWGGAASGSILLVITQGTGGSREIDFAGAGVKSTAAINLTNTVGAIDLVRLVWTGMQWVATDIVLNVV